MQSGAASVEAWMEALASNRREAVVRLRALCLERLHGWSERMEWGMPGYGPPGASAVVSFMDQKRSLSFYPGPTAVSLFAERLQGLDCGKGCIRYRNAAEMDFALIAEMLDTIRARPEHAAPCR